MPQINYTAQVSALTGRTENSINYGVDPNAFGADVGRANQNLGAAQKQAGQVALEFAIKEKERKKREALANEVAQSDFTKTELDMRNEVPADGSGYQERVVSKYRDFIDERANAIDDDEVRLAYKEKMLANLDNVSARAAQFEFTAGAEHSKLQADTSLNGLNNRIASDPLFYDDGLKQGYDVIDARPDMTAGLKEGMKQQFRYDSANRRFEGMLRNAKSVNDLDNIALDAAGKTGREWSEEFLPQDYEKLMNSIGTARKQFEERANSDAKAVLSSLEDRTKENTALIGTDELQQSQEVVKRSTDTVIRTRMARVMRDQDIIRTEQGLPPGELRSHINAINGNPGLAYPDLPAPVSSAVNEASTKFGVSAGFLGGLAHREYGQYFTKNQYKVNQDFAPQPAHKDVDLRNFRSDVLAAVTQAGQSVGKPLIITAANKQDKSGTGINISTIGMSGVDKAKVAGSLVDAGFTGIAEYEGSLHVDMREAVPASFQEKDGKVWGGWTYLSPDVAKVLKDKGFASGAASSVIKRNNPVKQAEIDYGKGTAILDASGKPTSSATGVMQFTDSTWLFMIKNPDVADVMGVDTKDKSDAELLKLRADPRLSTLAAAAYAAKNQKVLENTLGRPINDAELYMAHFMGGDGALTFLTAYKNNPEASGAQILPQSAAANKPVFYDKGKELTVRQIYDNIAQDFTLAPSRIAFEDNETRERLLKKTEEGLKNDPITHAASVGSFSVLPLGEDGGFEARGPTSRAIADYYNISLTDMKPFSEDEAASLKKSLDEGSAEDNLQLMASIQSMGDEPAKAALKQLGEKDRVFAHAGDLYLEGERGVAQDIILGRKKIKDNPAIVDQVGATTQDISDTFLSVTGGALHDVNPEVRQGIQDAAFAYYVQKGNEGKFDKKVYMNAVQAVMGGKTGNPAVDDVNGKATFLPKGITADVMESAIANMRIEDYTRMSKQGVPPRYADGTIINPDDIRDEITLSSIGGGKYKMMLDDGSVLLTGNITNGGRAEAYVFVPDIKQLRTIATRPSVDNTRGYNRAVGRGAVK